MSPNFPHSTFLFAHLIAFLPSSTYSISVLLPTIIYSVIDLNLKASNCYCCTRDNDKLNGKFVSFDIVLDSYSLLRARSQNGIEKVLLDEGNGEKMMKNTTEKKVLQQPKLNLRVVA